VDVIEQKQTDALDEMELKQNTRRLFELMVEVLTEREREVLILRYGLCGRKPVTQSEIGEKLGISRSYVSRIEKKALNKLRKCFGRGIEEI